MNKSRLNVVVGDIDDEDHCWRLRWNIVLEEKIDEQILRKVVQLKLTLQ